MIDLYVWLPDPSFKAGVTLGKDGVLLTRYTCGINRTIGIETSSTLCGDHLDSLSLRFDLFWLLPGLQEWFTTKSSFHFCPA